jgi:hypothetical protein
MGLLQKEEAIIRPLSLSLFSNSDWRWLLCILFVLLHVLLEYIVVSYSSC